MSVLRIDAVTELPLLYEYVSAEGAFRTVGFVRVRGAMVPEITHWGPDTLAERDRFLLKVLTVVGTRRNGRDRSCGGRNTSGTPTVMRLHRRVPQQLRLGSATGCISVAGACCSVCWPEFLSAGSSAAGTARSSVRSSGHRSDRMW